MFRYSQPVVEPAVRIEMGDLYLDGIDTRLPLDRIGRGSNRLLGRVVFSIQGRELSTAAGEAIGEMDVGCWLQSLWQLEYDLRIHGQHVQHEYTGLPNPVLEFTRIGQRVHVRHVGSIQRPPLECSFAELQCAVQSCLEAMRSRLTSRGPGWTTWWEDTTHVLDPAWKDTDDETFFANRHSWMFGPMFEARLHSRSLAAHADAHAALSEHPAFEKYGPLPDLPGVDSMWIYTAPSLQRRVGLIVGGVDDVVYLSVPPGQTARVCQLPDEEANALWSHRGPPTQEALLFLRDLLEVVQQLAQRLSLETAVLADEGNGPPQCVLESGWIYAYAWAGLGTPSADPKFCRVPLSGL